MKTDTAPDLALEITRHIKASPQRVYDAWTDPAQLKKWFQPAEVKSEDFIADPKVGGKYRWNLVDSDGDKMSASGEYRELQPGKKIVFTWQWDDDEAWTNQTSIVTITLAERDGGTDLVFRHEQLPSEQSRDRHTFGWNSILDELDRFTTN